MKRNRKKCGKESVNMRRNGKEHEKRGSVFCDLIFKLNFVHQTAICDVLMCACEIYNEAIKYSAIWPKMLSLFYIYFLAICITFSASVTAYQEIIE